MRQASYTLTISTHGKGLTDISENIETHVRDSGIDDGLATLFCRHTSASLLIQENASPAAHRDLQAFFERIAPESRGYEHEEGQFILLSDKELEAVEPKLTKTIEITEFVKLDEIDPLLFDKPYYLEPEKRGRKAYALLREALRKSGKAGISRVVIARQEIDG